MHLHSQQGGCDAIRSLALLCDSPVKVCGKQRLLWAWQPLLRLLRASLITYTATPHGNSKNVSFKLQMKNIKRTLYTLAAAAVTQLWAVCGLGPVTERLRDWPSSAF